VDISAWLKSLERHRLASGIRDSLYLFPFLEAVHVMALSAVFGTIMIVDLRLLGFASAHRPFARMSSELTAYYVGRVCRRGVDRHVDVHDERPGLRW